ncbi:MAG: divergent polysaccharide deacetylase family protein [Desulfuromonadia bacterium]
MLTLFGVILLILLLLLGLEYLRRHHGSVEVPDKRVALPTTPPFSAYSTPSYERYTAVIPPPETSPLPGRRTPAGGGEVAIIVDDMGSSLPQLQSLMEIGHPLTFSIIPVLPHARDVAREAARRGYEVMIHLPMEPEGYPARRIEQDALLLSLSDDELRARVDRLAAAVPEAVGANNHMGSRFTASREKMDVVLRELKKRGLFFVDSVTTPKSVGYDTARRLEMRSARRQVFIDNDHDDASLRRQLERLADAARRHGSAIGICHPHPATIRVLSVVMPEMAREGIQFVFVSRLIP